ncbi:MAG TPA: helix-turn-helix domain-containing protein, partial [Yinghuangia sp.]|nr:helix-turn-helix domain-containing protein [Yinghuangia sp.]
GTSNALPDTVSSVDLARWAAYRFAEAVRIVDDAERRQRRAVWGLLCDEQPLAAATMADALGEPLPGVARVLAVDCDADDTDAVASAVRRMAGRGAWIVRDADDETPIVVLLAADGHTPDDDGAARRLARELTGRHPQCRVGSSPVAEPARYGTAYDQARHALAAARMAVGGYARFHAWLDPELLIARQAEAWARGTLAPLTTHRARRRGDPDAGELVGTLSMWLADRRTAGTRLGIHRNTLSGRLRLIQDVLGRDLRRVDDRAQLSLALRVSAVLELSADETEPGERAELTDLSGLSDFPDPPTSVRDLGAGHAPEPERGFADNTSSRAGHPADHRADTGSSGLPRTEAADRFANTAFTASRFTSDRAAEHGPAPETPGADGAGGAEPLDGTPARPRLPLDLPALEGWAYAGLRSLTGGPGGADARTLRVWLAHDARLSATAEALGLTVPGARKRLARIGGVLGLDLLHGPTAEADLWLALQVVDRPGGPHAVRDRRRAS